MIPHPSNQARARRLAEAPATKTDAELIAEAIGAGRVTQCPAATFSEAAGDFHRLDWKKGKGQKGKGVRARTVVDAKAAPAANSRPRVNR